MMPKNITFDQEATAKLKAGIDKLANAVKVTLGPGGTNVIYEKQFGIPSITKDGVTVAREIFLEDIIENMGAQLVKAVANKTADSAGDGTTTATVLAQAIFTAGIKNVAAGANRMDIKRGIDAAVQQTVANLKKMSQPVSGDDIQKIATISSNGDEEIGRLIATAMAKVGNDGIITVEDAKATNKTEVTIVEGMRLARGFISPYFITDQEKQEAVLMDPCILLYEGAVTSMRQLIPILEAQRENKKTQGRPVLLIVEDVIGEGLYTLIKNFVQKAFVGCAIQCPDFGEQRREIMKDIAAMTNATVINKETGLTLEKATPDHLGGAEKVRITKGTTIIIGGHGQGPRSQQRIAHLKAQLEDENVSEASGNQIRERLANLSNGIAVIHVGGATDVEILEKKDRLDDALHATRAAVQEGILPGGGVALIRSMPSEVPPGNPDFITGVDIIESAIQEPLKIIAENAGQNKDLVLSKVLEMEGNVGYDAKQLKYVDMIEAGIIDPTKVVRLALENAASIAGLLLTSRAVISHVEPPQQ